jgi:hypothetical protein
VSRKNREKNAVAAMICAVYADAEPAGFDKRLEEFSSTH